MKAKEKAEELVNKYRGRALPSQQATPFDVYMIAKECATICVEEIINSRPLTGSLSYWNEVRKEIEKL